jgi:hypothetical protein
MRCSDGYYYVVKFQNNPQHRRVLVNELLGTKLAAELGLPTTPVAVVEVSEELIALTPGLCVETPRARIPCQPGLQFGSRYLGDPRCPTVYDCLQNEQLSEVSNVQDFAGMLAFDKWTCNTDGRQTVFLKLDGESPAAYAVMIDQGFCFNAGEWNYPDAPLRGLYARNRVYESVIGMESFEPWIARLESAITEDVLDKIIREIPPEWYQDDYDTLLRLIEQLYRRRTRVPDLLIQAKASSRRPFPNWKSQRHMDEHSFRVVACGSETSERPSNRLSAQ